MDALRTFFILTFVLVLVKGFPFSSSPSAKQGATNSHAGDNLFVEGDKGQVDWNEIATGLINDHENDPQLEIKPNVKAKNVILFIGDGMGVSTVSAARIYSMQANRTTLSFDTMPVTGFARTYNTNAQVPDSAGAATAFLCGQKTKKSVLGVSQVVTANDCNKTSDNKIESILKHSIRAGKWAGMVTTTRITHATPAATFSHAAHRDYETDTERDALLRKENYGPADTSKCPDIASQLIDDVDNQKIRVVLGGGRRAFLPNTTADPEYPEQTGLRGDGRNLTQLWVDQKDSDKVHYVWKRDDFDRVNPDDTDYLMGLFEPSHMQFELDREQDRAGEPSLPEMVDKALRILRRSPEGFFLFVEGGRIDHAHHDTKAVKAMADTLALSEAVRTAQELTDPQDTLIVISADHSHVLTINGYPYINNDITGLVRDDNRQLSLMQDGKPYSTLSYTNGPGFLDHRTNYSSKDTANIKIITDDEVLPRMNLTGNKDVGNKDFYYDTSMYFYSETHSGEDVAVYASGPMSRMFTGVYEQNYIAHAMMFASCVGDYTNREGCDHSAASPIAFSYASVIVSALIALVFQVR